MPRDCWRRVNQSRLREYSTEVSDEQMSRHVDMYVRCALFLAKQKRHFHFFGRKFDGSSSRTRSVQRFTVHIVCSPLITCPLACFLADNSAHLCTCCDETCACATNGHGSRGGISAPTHAAPRQPAEHKHVLPPRRQPGRHAALAGEAIQHVGRAHGRGQAMVRVCGRRPSRGAGGGRDDRRGGCRVQGHPHTLANWRCPRGEPEEQLIAQGLVPIEALEGWPPKQQRQQQEGLVESSAKLHVDDDTGVPHIQGLDFRCATRRAGGRLSRGRSQGRRGSRRGSAGGAGWNGK